jgi:hypothetical protein
LVGEQAARTVEAELLARLYRAGRVEVDALVRPTHGRRNEVAVLIVIDEARGVLTARCVDVQPFCLRGRWSKLEEVVRMRGGPSSVPLGDAPLGERFAVV